ncbi:MAG: ionic transporter y4hA [Armatimonadetes bacterium]|nr:ionic transporter y4hA [Armatimonadota bacterium]
MRAFPVIAPVVAVLAWIAVVALPGPVSLWIAVLGLVLAVIAAVHHAEIIALRVGEPYGTLVLALAMTTIEAALVLSLMLMKGPGSASLARDTVYAAIMTICSGVLGVCLFWGGLKHREQVFRVDGATSALAALVALAGLTLVLPNHTTSSPGATYSPAQLAVVALLSFVLWAVFVMIQTGRHREYFLSSPEVDGEHDRRPSSRESWTSTIAMVVGLVAVVLLAKAMSKPVEGFVESIGAPRTLVGVLISFLVLLPETGASIRAALANRLQTSMNLAMGSAPASIGLTIPVVAVASLGLRLPLELGLGPKETILLTLTFIVNGLTLGLGRSNILLGAVHLILFAVFLLTSFLP